MKMIVPILFSLFAVTAAFQGCQWNHELSPAQMWNETGQHLFTFNYYVPQAFTRFIVLVHITPAASNWIDVIYDVGPRAGRASLIDRGSLNRELDPTSSPLSLTYIVGNATAQVNVQVSIPQQYTPDPGHCNFTVQQSEAPSFHRRDQAQTRGKRAARDPPEWVSLQESPSAAFMYLWPIRSLYGVGTLALAEGPEIWQGHEYVQLPTKEKSFYGLQVPGVGLAGPSWGHQSTDYVNYAAMNQMFKYSKRDAAWVLWDYKYRRPLHDYDRDSDYWSFRHNAVPAVQPGLVFDHSE